jgi:hypothetical protein
VTCQKFCGISGHNFIKHIFSTRSSTEAISFFIMLPSSFTSVSLLNFWQVFRSQKALNQSHYQKKMGPALDYRLTRLSSLILVMQALDYRLMRLSSLILVMQALDYHLMRLSSLILVMQALDYCLMRLSSLILVMLPLNLWLYTTQNIFAYRSDLRTLQRH